MFDAFSDYQLPELLRTPLQSLCLQIKSLRLGSISEFLSRALQPPEPLSVCFNLNFISNLHIGENPFLFFTHSMLPFFSFFFELP